MFAIRKLASEIFILMTHSIFRFVKVIRMHVNGDELSVDLEKLLDDGNIKPQSRYIGGCTSGIKYC